METSLVATLVLSSIPIESIDDIRALIRMGIVSKRWYRGSVDALRVLLPGVANRQAEALATRTHLLTLLPEQWALRAETRQKHTMADWESGEVFIARDVEVSLIRQWFANEKSRKFWEFAMTSIGEAFFEHPVVKEMYTDASQAAAAAAKAEDESLLRALLDGISTTQQRILQPPLPADFDLQRHAPEYTLRELAHLRRKKPSSLVRTLHATVNQVTVREAIEQRIDSCCSRWLAQQRANQPNAARVLTEAHPLLGNLPAVRAAVQAMLVLHTWCPWETEVPADEISVKFPDDTAVVKANKLLSEHLTPAGRQRLTQKALSCLYADTRACSLWTLRALRSTLPTMSGDRALQEYVSFVGERITERQAAISALQDADPFTTAKAAGDGPSIVDLLSGAVDLPPQAASFKRAGVGAASAPPKDAQRGGGAAAPAGAASSQGMA